MIYSTPNHRLLTEICFFSIPIPTHLQFSLNPSLATTHDIGDHIGNSTSNSGTGAALSDGGDLGVQGERGGHQQDGAQVQRVLADRTEHSLEDTYDVNSG